MKLKHTLQSAIVNFCFAIFHTTERMPDHGQRDEVCMEVFLPSESHMLMAAFTHQGVICDGYLPKIIDMSTFTAGTLYISSTQPSTERHYKLKRGDGGWYYLGESLGCSISIFACLSQLLDLMNPKHKTIYLYVESK